MTDTAILKKRLAEVDERLHKLQLSNLTSVGHEDRSASFADIEKLKQYKRQLEGEIERAEGNSCNGPIVPRL